MGHFRKMKAVSAHRPVLPNNNHIRFVRDAVVERSDSGNVSSVEPHNKTENRPPNPRSTFTWKIWKCPKASNPSYCPVEATVFIHERQCEDSTAAQSWSAWRVERQLSSPLEITTCRVISAPRAETRK